MGKSRAFLVPVCVDDTRDADADVPDSFATVQWTRLPGGETPPAFSARINALLGAPVASSGSTSAPVAPTTKVDAAAAKATPRVRLVAIAVSILVLVGLAYVVIERSRLANRTPVDHSVAAVAPAPAAQAIPEKSVAVLPFVDMSEKKDQEYFSDGLSEELIDMLTKIPELQVPARTSSFYFKGKQTTIADIGKVLGVANVLEGSVRKAGNTVRITAQLIRVSNGYHLWSETYDRNLDDIFKVQDDISNAVVRALKASLLGRVSAPETGKVNPEAYTLFLQAKSRSNHWNSPAEINEGIDYIEQSIKLDPTFAPAWALLSRARSALAAGDLLLGEKNWTDARIAAEKAISLAPNDDKGYCAMAKINWLHDFDLAAARVQSQRALQLNEGCGLTWGGYIAVAIGDFDEGIELIKRGVKQDPLNSFGYMYLAADEIYAGKLSDAKVNIGKVKELNPKADVHFLEGLISLEEGNPRAAYEAFEHVTGPDDRLAGQAVSLYAMGRKGESDQALKALKNGYSKKSPFNIAMVYAFRGDADQAFQWLDKAYIARDYGCPFVKVYPLLRNVRSDPRFKAFLRKMNLPD
jgi:TolB-like protein